MIDLKDYGFDPTRYSVSEKSNYIPARITSVHRERYGVICAQGESFARLKSGVYRANPSAVYPTVGDFVLLYWNASGDSLIVETLPRKSFFARSDGFGSRGMQAIAANIDYALLVSSLNRDFNPRRLERYLTQTLQSGAKPVFVLTKADLCPNPSEYIEQVRIIAQGAPVHAISAHTGFGMDALAPYLQSGTTLALLGMSGVGKSSLLNALMGYERMKVNRMRDVDSSKGRHTTTHRELIRLPSGALVIDTPGMRELGVWSAEDGVEEAFSDIEQLAAKCRFSDCRHEQEPGCAVRAALERGEIDAKRLKNYLDLQRQAQRTARIAAMRAKKSGPRN